MSGRMAFFEKCMISRGLCRPGLSLSGGQCKLSFSGPLHDILHHLLCLITKHKEMCRRHLHHRHDILIHLFPPHITAECPILLFSNEFKPTWTLSRFSKINGIMTISPEWNALFNLKSVRIIRQVQYNKNTYGGKWQCDGSNGSFITEVHGVTNVLYVNCTLYLAIRRRNGGYNKIGMKKTCPSLRILIEKVEGGNNICSLLLTWRSIRIKVSIHVKEWVDNHTASRC